jgi:hypothetical protein
MSENIEENDKGKYLSFYQVDDQEWFCKLKKGEVEQIYLKIARAAKTTPIKSFAWKGENDKKKFFLVCVQLVELIMSNEKLQGFTEEDQVDIDENHGGLDQYNPLQKDMDPKDEYFFTRNFFSIKEGEAIDELGEMLKGHAKLFGSMVEICSRKRNNHQEMMQFLKQMFLVEYHRCLVAHHCGKEKADIFYQKHRSMGFTVSEENLIKDVTEMKLRYKKQKKKNANQPSKNQTFIKCYECGAKGHKKTECPLLKNK